MVRLLATVGTEEDSANELLCDAGRIIEDEGEIFRLPGDEGSRGSKLLRVVDDGKIKVEAETEVRMLLETSWSGEVEGDWLVELLCVTGSGWTNDAEDGILWLPGAGWDGDT